MESRRLAVNVAGDIAGLNSTSSITGRSCRPIHHRRRNASYDIWEPYWVSAKVGFILFVNRGVSPQESELWRTINGGTGWTMIGHWVHAAGNVYPDITGRSMLFVDANFGVSPRGPPRISACCGPRTAARTGRCRPAERPEFETGSRPCRIMRASTPRTGSPADRRTPEPTWGRHAVRLHDLGDRGRGRHVADQAHVARELCRLLRRGRRQERQGRAVRHAVCVWRRPCTANCAAPRASGARSPTTTSSPTRATVRRTSRWSGPRLGACVDREPDGPWAVPERGLRGRRSPRSADACRSTWISSRLQGLGAGRRTDVLNLRRRHHAGSPVRRRRHLLPRQLHLGV